ncbi:MAG: hypothetical protein QOJ02_3787 [Acidobacteriota bacterium]|jgi:hypothetical protein|nr:hypothetical protein [Acidobacteriota bacterium]
MNPINDLFQQTLLFLLKLLGHLIIHTLILLFVLVGFHLHQMFIDHAFDAEKSTVTIKKQPSVIKHGSLERGGKKKHKRSSRIKSSRQLFQNLPVMPIALDGDALHIDCT